MLFGERVFPLTRAGIVVLTVVVYDSRLIWREPVPTHAISA